MNRKIHWRPALIVGLLLLLPGGRGDLRAGADPATGTGEEYSPALTGSGDYEIIVESADGVPTTIFVTAVQPREIEYRRDDGGWTVLPTVGPDFPWSMSLGASVLLRAVSDTQTAVADVWPAEQPTWAVQGGLSGGVHAAPPAATEQWVFTPSELGEYTISLTCGDATVERIIEVIADPLLQARVDTNEWIDVADFTHVPVGKPVEFRALPSPTGGAWPAGYPEWGGVVAAPPGGATAFHTFLDLSTTAADTAPVVVGYGLVVTANVVVADLRIDVAGGATRVPLGSGATATAVRVYGAAETNVTARWTPLPLVPETEPAIEIVGSAVDREVTLHGASAPLTFDANDRIDTPPSHMELRAVDDDEPLLSATNNLAVVGVAAIKKEFPPPLDYLSPPPFDAVAHWSFHEGSGFVADDVSANANTGVLHNATWTSNGVVRGDANDWWWPANEMALAFNGTDAYVDVADDDSLDLDGDITVLAWVSFGADVSNEVVLVSKKDAPGGSGYELAFDPATAQYVFRGDGSLEARSDPLPGLIGQPPASGPRHHLAVVVRDGSATFHVNGIVRAADLAVDPPSTNSLPLLIGRRGAGSAHFSGVLDDVAIYARALSFIEPRAFLPIWTSGFPSPLVPGYYPWRDVAGGGFSGVSPICVERGRSNEFMVLPTSSPWPDGKPVFEGDAAVVGFADPFLGAYFHEPSEHNQDFKTLVAECGNEKTVNALVLELRNLQYDPAGAQPVSGVGWRPYTEPLHAAIGEPYKFFGRLNVQVFHNGHAPRDVPRYYATANPRTPPFPHETVDLVNRADVAFGTVHGPISHQFYSRSTTATDYDYMTAECGFTVSEDHIALSVPVLTVSLSTNRLSYRQGSDPYAATPEMLVVARGARIDFQAPVLPTGLSDRDLPIGYPRWFAWTNGPVEQPEGGAVLSRTFTNLSADAADLFTFTADMGVETATGRVMVIDIAEIEYRMDASEAFRVPSQRIAVAVGDEVEFRALSTIDGSWPADCPAWDGPPGLAAVGPTATVAFASVNVGPDSPEVWSVNAACGGISTSVVVQAVDFSLPVSPAITTIVNDGDDNPRTTRHYVSRTDGASLGVDVAMLAEVPTNLFQSWSLEGGSGTDNFHRDIDIGTLGTNVVVLTIGSVVHSAVVVVVEHRMDFDVDSDNDSGYTLDGSAAEESLETTPPGKIAVVNDGIVAANVPGFAVDAVPLAGCAGAAGPFHKVVVRASAEFADPAARIRVLYAGSDPADVDDFALPPHPQFNPRRYMAAPGSLRLWTADGPVCRNSGDLAAAGDYVAPDTWYATNGLAIDPPADTNLHAYEFTLYVEAVRAVYDEPITVQFSLGEVVLEDIVHITSVPRELYPPDADRDGIPDEIEIEQGLTPSPSVDPVGWWPLDGVWGRRIGDTNFVAELTPNVHFGAASGFPDWSLPGRGVGYTSPWLREESTVGTGSLVEHPILGLMGSLAGEPFYGPWTRMEYGHFGLKFSGGDLVRVADSNAVTHATDALDMGPSDWSVHLWIKTTFEVASPGMIVLDKRQWIGGSPVGYAVDFDATGRVRAVFAPGAGVGAIAVSSLAPLNDGVSHQIVATYDRDGVLALYVDGAFQASSAIAAHAAVDVANDADLLFGSVADAAAAELEYVGALDDVRLYDRVLAPADRDLLREAWVDADADTLPDWWELLYFPNTNVSSGDIDADGDGLTNREEYEVARSPTDGDTEAPLDVTELTIHRTEWIAGTDQAWAEIEWRPSASPDIAGYEYELIRQETPGGPAVHSTGKVDIGNPLIPGRFRCRLVVTNAMDFHYTVFIHAYDFSRNITSTRSAGFGLAIAAITGTRFVHPSPPLLDEEGEKRRSFASIVFLPSQPDDLVSYHGNTFGGGYWADIWSELWVNGHIVWSWATDSFYGGDYHVQNPLTAEILGASGILAFEGNPRIYGCYDPFSALHAVRSNYGIKFTEPSAFPLVAPVGTWARIGFEHKKPRPLHRYRSERWRTASSSPNPAAELAFRTSPSLLPPDYPALPAGFRGSTRAIYARTPGTYRAEARYVSPRRFFFPASGSPAVAVSTTTSADIHFVGVESLAAEDACDASNAVVDEGSDSPPELVVAYTTNAAGQSSAMVTLTATATPVDFPDECVEWTLDDVLLEGESGASITVAVPIGPHIYAARCGSSVRSVHVTATPVVFNPDPAYMCAGTTTVVTVTALHANGPPVVYESATPSIATVSGSAPTLTIHGHDAGTAEIVAKVSDCEVARVTVSVIKVNLDSYEPGTMSSPGTLIAEAEEDDPGALYSLINKDNDDDDPVPAVGTGPRDNDDAVVHADDDDIFKITLRRPVPSMSEGTLHLSVSVPSAVNVFKSDGSALLSDYSVDLASPAGDLAGLATGEVDVFLEGVGVDDDVTVRLTYRDPGGNEVCFDEVHLSIFDVSFEFCSFCSVKLPEYLCLDEEHHATVTFAGLPERLQGQPFRWEIVGEGAPAGDAGFRHEGADPPVPFVNPYGSTLPASAVGELTVAMKPTAPGGIRLKMIVTNPDGTAEDIVKYGTSKDRSTVVEVDLDIYRMDGTSKVDEDYDHKSGSITRILNPGASETAGTGRDHSVSLKLDPSIEPAGITSLSYELRLKSISDSRNKGHVRVYRRSGGIDTKILDNTPSGGTAEATLTEAQLGDRFWMEFGRGGIIEVELVVSDDTGPFCADSVRACGIASTPKPGPISFVNPAGVEGFTHDDFVDSAAATITVALEDAPVNGNIVVAGNTYDVAGLAVPSQIMIAGLGAAFDPADPHAFVFTDLPVVSGGGMSRVFSVEGRQDVYFSGLAIRDGHAVVGGGIRLSESANVSIDFCEIADNWSPEDDRCYGGGVAVLDCTGVGLRGCFIHGNKVHGRVDPDTLLEGGGGGGLYVENGEDIEVRDSHFERNEAGQYGGAVALRGTTLFPSGPRDGEIVGNYFGVNEAGIRLAGFGGAIALCGRNDDYLRLAAATESAVFALVGGYEEVLLAKNVFSLNASITDDLNLEIWEARGGGVYAGSDQTEVHFVENEFTQNASHGDAGAVCTMSGADLDGTECLFVQNFCVDDGGAMSHGTRSMGSWESCQILDNEAGHNGGGIHASALSSVNIGRCQIAANSSHGEVGGGGAYVRNAFLLSAGDNQFVNNTAANNGGGIMIDYSKANPLTTVQPRIELRSGDTVVGNLSRLHGGGIHVQRQTRNPPLVYDHNHLICDIENAGFTGNRAGSSVDGARTSGLYIENSENYSVRDSSFEGHAEGAAILIVHPDDSSGLPRVEENNTFDGNLFDVEIHP